VARTPNNLDDTRALRDFYGPTMRSQDHQGFLRRSLCSQRIWTMRQDCAYASPQTARRFRDLVEAIGNDLGGVDHLSEGQKQLIRRAATLSIMAEAMEADAVRNLAFDGEAYGVLCDRLGRCLQRLGLERKPRDVTPDLKSYLEAKDRPT
jgi:hypothetical protein